MASLYIRIINLVLYMMCWKQSWINGRLNDGWLVFHRVFLVQGFGWSLALSLSGWWFGTFFMFPYIGKNHPNWRTHIFQSGRYTTNQIIYIYNVNPGWINPVCGCLIGRVPFMYHSLWLFGGYPLINKPWVKISIIRISIIGKSENGEKGLKNPF